MTASRFHQSRSFRLAAVLTLSAGMVLSTTGCDDAGSGALAGGAIGALAGLGIGSLSGNAGSGAAIGAIAGGVGGAIIGDQNERADDRQRGYNRHSKRDHQYDRGRYDYDPYNEY